ncbi:GNAT family N-acetyltransferase [Hyphomonas johnsonii]|uniref:Acetyltransferase n=1 Tax=Hyphomonas johnsonii MHS-2 TaxID=1280950 RepID=A0A059FH95_9PROT|nr:N-acetyltransferase [Hyphomonas johnsonii]KCZ89977.1 acetyltransferase [Hyphomonas johnsonii MHS-2]
MLEIIPETPAIHAEAIEALFDATFGPGHFAKTAERLREYSRSLPDITRLAVLDGEVIAVCRVWPLVVGPARTRALFYGPVAVAPAHQGSRLGLTVTGEALEAGKGAGWPAAVLIGAPKYFGEIGFKVTPKNQLAFHGPQDQARVMVRDLAGDASALSGLVTAL